MNIHMLIAWGTQIQQQSKFYASGLSNDQAFFSVLIDRVHSTSHTAMEAKNKHTTVFDIESNCILTKI